MRVACSLYVFTSHAEIAERYGYHAPVAEQCRHNLLARERAEGEYDALYKKYNMGTTVFSALASGMLTGKVRARARA